MNCRSILRNFLVLAAPAVFTALATQAHAQDANTQAANTADAQSLAAIARTVNGPLPGVTVGKGWTRATPDPGKSAPAYFTIHNAGGTPDTLVSVSCPIAHKTLLIGPDDKPVAGLPIKAGETLTLGPGGIHVLLEHNRFRLFPKAIVPCSVDFDGAGKMILYLYVESENASGYRPVHGTPTSH